LVSEVSGSIQGDLEIWVREKGGNNRVDLSWEKKISKGCSVLSAANSNCKVTGSALVWMALTGRPTINQERARAGRKFSTVCDRRGAFRMREEQRPCLVGKMQIFEQAPRFVQDDPFAQRMCGDVGHPARRVREGEIRSFGANATAALRTTPLRKESFTQLRRLDGPWMT